MKKGYHASKLISSLSVTALLLYFMMINTGSKITFIPFLICSIAMTCKHLALFFNKNNLANLFNKIFTVGFLLFLFGFLILAMYICIRDKNYTMLLFTLPFWIAGFFIIKKRFFNNKSMNKSSRFSFPIVMSALLVGTVFVSGVVILCLGIKDTYELNWKTKDYVAVEGYFDHYDVYDADEDGITYQLTYTFTVDNNVYSVATDYGTNYIPEAGSSREIKYDPSNPEQAVIMGTNKPSGLIYFGAFFTFGSLTFVIAALTVMGYFDKFRIDVLGTYVGVLITVVGIGIILFQTGTTGSLMETVKSFGLLMIIPIMLIVFGIIQTIKCLVKAFHN